MNRFILLACLSLAIIARCDEQDSKGVNWVVLVAGSSEWYNYRHQVTHTIFLL